MHGTRDRDRTHPRANPVPPEWRAECERLGIAIWHTDIGVGVFAMRALAAGEHIGDMTGTLIEGEDYESDYAAQIHDALSLEPTGPLRELNHRCEPNCCLTPAPAAQVVSVHALRDIASGEELTIDYGWPADENCVLCACDSEHCRVWVVAASELVDWPYLFAWTNWDAAPPALIDKFDRRFGWRG